MLSAYEANVINKITRIPFKISWNVKEDKKNEENRLLYVLISLILFSGVTIHQKLWLLFCFSIVLCFFFVFASLFSFNFILYFLCKFYIELSSCVLVSVLLHNQLKTRDNAYAPTILLYRIVLYFILLYCVPLLHYIVTIFEMTEGLKVMFKALVLAFLF